ncbi:NADP-dependent oxidoreductase domain-containing protein [Crucibulum laeve]|uniref:NADP-dependent oxidoreductase domain-containing protein n=1 Tax=Crucibulum laeve TaxID=68775 RepID=A0A5C3MD28_9AGAR|nr:NADP-dependent oxidoreductase domain-containing protein [Crucibulum laeve]
MAPLVSMYAPAPPPPTGLGRYRALSQKASVHVSPIQLGAMSIGDQWSDVGMGSMDKESSFKLLDAYFDNGGNFIDTANGYQDGSSEQFIGEWAEKRGIRSQLFIATKYTTNFKQRDPNVKQKVLFVGNNTKSLHMSVETSLENLRTSYIDLLYLHWWDYDTDVEEVMRSLHTLVLQGKVLYLGISDTPAWVVAQANQYARDHALTPFVIYQGSWNVMERSFEREIICKVQDLLTAGPIAYLDTSLDRSLSLISHNHNHADTLSDITSKRMALAPWGVLAGGKFRTDGEEEKRRQTGEQGRMVFDTTWERNETEKKVSYALETVAGEVGAKHITSVAIAYLLHKATYVFPIIGGRKPEHLLANLEALEISLTKDQIKYLESVVPFDAGFPSSMIGNGEEYNFLIASGANLVKQPIPQPITPKAN